MQYYLSCLFPLLSFVSSVTVQYSCSSFCDTDIMVVPVGLLKFCMSSTQQLVIQIITILLYCIPVCYSIPVWLYCCRRVAIVIFLMRILFVPCLFVGEHILSRIRSIYVGMQLHMTHRLWLPLLMSLIGCILPSALCNGKSTKNVYCTHFPGFAAFSRLVA